MVTVANNPVDEKMATALDAIEQTPTNPPIKSDKDYVNSLEERISNLEKLVFELQFKLTSIGI
jgi:hypothetical protein